MVKKTKTGKQSPVNDKYKHEEFKEMYDQFLKMNIIKDAKSAAKALMKFLRVDNGQCLAKRVFCVLSSPANRF
ncbi:MAG: hypothetical protein WDO19_08905 [Bacteroidota bacterium]